MHSRRCESYKGGDISCEPSCTFIIEWRCSQCDEIERIEYKVNEEPADIPDDWSYGEEGVICPAH